MTTKSHLELNTETAAILNGLLRVEFDKIQQEKKHWEETPDFEHISPALDDRLSKVEILQLEVEAILEYCKEGDNFRSSDNSNQSECKPYTGLSPKPAIKDSDKREGKNL